MEKWEKTNKGIKQEVKKDMTKQHKETLKISNRLIGRYMKRLNPLKTKGFKSTEIRKIYQDSIKELERMVSKIKI